MPKHTKQLIVLVKAPIAGQCKTRLIPLLGAQQASEFYKAMVSNCFNQLQTFTHINTDIDIAIYATPNIHHPFIQQLNKNITSTLHIQQGNNLGDRMYNAMQTSLHNHSKVILIGTDCPPINQKYIQQAFKALDQCDIVFGPAEDGGYVLIGANKLEHQLFKSIEWGSEKVLSQSLNNCHRQEPAYSTQQLATLWDIDTPEDYIKHQKYIEKHITEQMQEHT